MQSQKINVPAQNRTVNLLICDLTVRRASQLRHGDEIRWLVVCIAKYKILKICRTIWYREICLYAVIPQAVLLFTQQIRLDPSLLAIIIVVLSYRRRQSIL